jgi:hypothetical protein
MNWSAHDTFRERGFDHRTVFVVTLLARTHYRKNAGRG